MTPVAYWRSYLGGRTDEAGMLVADVNADGEIEVLYVDAGRIVARRADGTVAWRSRSLGINHLVGIGNLDGNGPPDVLANSDDHAYVLGGASGDVQWAEPDGEMGTLALVRAADLDGDGLVDLLMQEHGCASANSGKTGFAYSFAGGFDAPKLLYTLPWKTCGATVTTVIDLDGKGTKALAVPTAMNDGLALLNAVTGVPLVQTEAFTGFMSMGRCAAMNIDQLPGDELVCMQNSPSYGGERQVFVARFSTSPTPSLGVLWTHVIGDKVGGDLSMLADSLVDLDGDGTVELVVSGKTGGGWTTHVYAAATGDELASISSARFAGTAALELSTTRGILTAAGENLSAFAFQAGKTPTIVPRWTLPGRALPVHVDPALAPRQSLIDRSVHADLNGDGIDEVVVTALGSGAAVEVYSGAGSAVSLVAQRTLPNLVDPVAFWMLPGIGGNWASLGVGRNDGYLQVFDGQLKPIWGGSKGVRVGGYYSGLAKVGLTPVAASLGAGTQESVLVVDSRGALLRVDAVDGTFAAPPKASWSVGGMHAPAIVPGIDQGSAGIACFRALLGAEPTYEVSLLRRDGTISWTRPFPWKPQMDVLPADLDGDGIPDFFVQGYDPQTAINTRAISGKDGATLWDYAPVPMLGGVQLFSSTDWNGDGRPDLLTVLDEVRAISGADGSELATSSASYSYFAPIPLDVDGDGLEELVLQGGALPALTLNHDLKTALWASLDDDTPLPLGAIAQCHLEPPRLVEGSAKHPARLKITRLSGANAGVFSTAVLAGGKRYDTEGAALADGAALGHLGEISVEADLTGTQRPSAVVGSTDGWLYAVNPCTGDLDFSVDLGAPVGEPIFADTDGDGRDEILVTVDDGYLYDIKNKNMNAPTFVWDVDPAHGVVDHDIADVETVNRLSGRWGAVTGATGYQVAVVDDQGDYVSKPSWLPAGTSLQTTLAGLELSDGGKYAFAVRALSKAGPSVDTVSDGVSIHFPPPLDAGVGGGADAGPESTMRGGGGAEDELLSGRACTCEFRGQRGPAGEIASLALGLLTAAGRWRRTSRKRTSRSVAVFDDPCQLGDSWWRCSTSTPCRSPTRSPRAARGARRGRRAAKRCLSQWLFTHRIPVTAVSSALTNSTPPRRSPDETRITRDAGAAIIAHAGSLTGLRR